VAETRFGVRRLPSGRFQASFTDPRDDASQRIKELLAAQQAAQMGA
jgi:hypothetical protein